MSYHKTIARMTRLVAVVLAIAPYATWAKTAVISDLPPRTETAAIGQRYESRPAQAPIRFAAQRILPHSGSCPRSLPSIRKTVI